MPRGQNSPGKSGFSVVTSDLREVLAPAIGAAPGATVISSRLNTAGLCNMRAIVVQTAGPALGGFYLRLYRGGPVVAGDAGAIFDDVPVTPTLALNTPVSVVWGGVVASHVSLVVDVSGGPVGAYSFTVRLMACA